MNERIKELAEQAGMGPMGIAFSSEIMQKFAELIIAEHTAVLFNESERLSELYLEETNMQLAEQYEVCSDQCIYNIALIEKHFRVEK